MRRKLTSEHKSIVREQAAKYRGSDRKGFIHWIIRVLRANPDLYFTE